MNTGDIFQCKLGAYMDEEQKEKYAKFGQAYFGRINIEDCVKTKEQEEQEVVAYIIVGLKSGLHPSCLTKVEHELLEKIYGKYWYKTLKLGYKTIDIDKIKKNLK